MHDANCIARETPAPCRLPRCGGDVIRAEAGGPEIRPKRRGLWRLRPDRSWVTPFCLEFPRLARPEAGPLGSVITLGKRSGGQPFTPCASSPARATSLSPSPRAAAPERSITLGCGCGPDAPAKIRVARFYLGNRTSRTRACRMFNCPAGSERDDFVLTCPMCRRDPSLTAANSRRRTHPAFLWRQV